MLLRAQPSDFRRIFVRHLLSDKRNAHGFYRHVFTQIFLIKKAKKTKKRQKNMSDKMKVASDLARIFFAAKISFYTSEKKQTKD